jgi:hypothetical protein
MFARRALIVKLRREKSKMSEQKNEGGFPQNESRGQDPTSTTGDGHPPRPGEKGTQENTAGQGLGQTGQGGKPSGGSGS